MRDASAAAGRARRLRGEGSGGRGRGRGRSGFGGPGLLLEPGQQLVPPPPPFLESAACFSLLKLHLTFTLPRKCFTSRWRTCPG